MTNNYRNFKFDENNRYLIMVKIETYNRTESGKCWKNKPSEVENKVYTDENYTNYITSIPFFNNFGYMSSCRAKKSYTIAGYLPTIVTTINPDSSVKKIATFKFYNKDYIFLNAGYREKEIINNARYYQEFKSDNNHNCITFITADNKSCVYDFKNNNFVG